MHKKTLIFLTILLTIATIALRLAPHAPNFAPLGALILFTGFLAPRQMALLPIAALAVTDLAIGAYDAGVMISVYASYALMLGAAYTLRSRYSFATALITGMAGAVVFYLITNAAVWRFWPQMYGADFSGLVASYAAGIPFFRNTLAGYLFYSAAFFGLFEAVHALARIKNSVELKQTIPSGSEENF